MRIAFGLVIAVLVLTADQVTKWWILTQVFGFQPPIGTMHWHPPIEITGFFNLVMVWNYGVSFGLMSGEGADLRWWLVGLTVGITAVLAIWLFRTGRRFLAIVLGMVIGGAIGNIIDRVRLGAVADFFDLHAFGWHWPAFNIADSAIVIGMCLLVLDSLFVRPATTDAKAP